MEGRTAWVVQNFANSVAKVRLSPDLTSGTVVDVITSDLFRVPTTVARHGSTLALVNGRFDLGFPPPFGPGGSSGGPTSTSCRSVPDRTLPCSYLAT